MITIAGGVYLEVCLHPHWQELYGSGGRAAAALAGATSVELHTYIDDSWRRVLDARADAYGFRLSAQQSPSTIQFDYVHPLAVPRISPHPAEIHKLASQRIDGEVLLRFGMLESDVVSNGERVVYDPQSAANPRRYGDNGSTATSLAILANSNEAGLLTGRRDPRDAACDLITREHAEVAIVKRGVHGAIVATPTGVFEVAPFRRSLMFTIGSGDVFAAAFTFFWGEKRLEPRDAAELASRATALYCESRALPLPSEPDLRAAELREAQFRPGKVYLAAPFFNLGQRWLVEEARAHLSSLGLQVFSPLHEVGRGPADVVAPADLAGLDGCDRMLALIDGADVGTVFEVGYARARGIPVVALSETLPEESLKMIEGSGCITTRDFASAVYLTAWVE